MTKGVGFARALFLFGLTRPPIRPWEDAAILAHPDARLSERIYDSRTPGRLPMVSGVAPISHSKRILELSPLSRLFREGGSARVMF